jgi:hypothetical protein
LSRNPTIFENLQKDLDKDRMLIFKDLPLPVNLNNRKIYKIDITIIEYNNEKI